MTSPHTLPHTRTKTVKLPSASAAAKFVAHEIDKLVRERNAVGQPTVLGLATGSTPVSLYRELIRLHTHEGLDLSRVVTFNLDEYFPMSRESQHSYFRWMRDTLFRHVNIAPENIHIPDGTLPPDAVEAFCADYEEKIKAAGGIDIQILGIGRTGHIAFNEPGSPPNSRTRLVTLDSITRRDAADGFFGEENVPHHALTMGVASILDARRIFLMAYGEHKAGIVYKALEQPPTEAISASFLQDHPDATFVLDEAAAAELTAIKRPWEVGPCTWTPELVRKAVVALSLKVKKGLQKLNDDDFRDHHLYELLREKGPAERIGEVVFHDRMETITPFPAGALKSRGEGKKGRKGEEDNQPPSTLHPFTTSLGAHAAQAKTVPRLLAAPGRRRHLDGRDDHSIGRARAHRSRRVHDERERRGVRPRCAAVR